MSILSKISDVVNDHYSPNTYLSGVVFNEVSGSTILGTTPHGLNITLSYVVIQGNNYPNIRSTNEVPNRSSTVHHPSLNKLMDELFNSVEA